ncbi:hypothetical protein C8J57DRAFT_1525303 [Mycena rebaudengoi]|nr:hypothetical protein C8J57DRAFT_1525303 [Mycena rebaudengoi]
MASLSTTLTLTIKSLCPPTQYSLTRLLKGKALPDNKLVMEYSVKDGDTFNLLVKPSTTTTAEMASDDSQPSLSIDLKGSPGAGVPAHPQRGLQPVALGRDLPSSSGSLPSTRSRQNRTTRNVTLTLDNATPALAEHELGMYHAGITNPQFWQDLLAYLGTSLPPADAQLAFKEFLRGATGTLTASEIARVRDQAGVTDLGGLDGLLDGLGLLGGRGFDYLVAELLRLIQGLSASGCGHGSLNKLPEAVQVLVSELLILLGLGGSCCGSCGSSSALIGMFGPALDGLL